MTPACICEGDVCLDSRFVDVERADECPTCRTLTIYHPCPAIPGSGVPSGGRRERD